jgi:L-lactate dehydrogenase complex protein LldE
MSESPAQPGSTEHGPHVALFVTCLADLFRPSVGFASIDLLERAGCRVSVPQNQTCCGQPSYNNGDYNSASKQARMVVESLEDFEYVVAPSGSCAGMIRHHYPRLLKGEWQHRAEAVAVKTFELTAFLYDVMSLPQPDGPAKTQAKVAYHDGCAGLRELDVRQQPRALLKEQCGIDAMELQGKDVCCGFGGTFCAKMPEISAKMADDKLADALNTGADTLVGGDLGCLLTLAGRASRSGRNIEVRHIAELLSGNPDTPPIGQGEDI